jgi:hypothetical protein
VRQVVERNGPIAAGGKPLADVASDEACAAGHENIQSIPPRIAPREFLNTPESRPL